ncbi:MAG: succinyl-diaminopimelate desuccinylase [Proteobacteria bacterium]|nr:succinyl-diaminopimelate desuccinylase [Pseudomonadota bacterium]
MSSLKNLLADLIAFPSITPLDAGCQAYLIKYLEELGFTCQCFDNPPVSNFFARIGDSEPLLIFAGHTDVVPVGNESSWHHDPFEMQEKNGFLYGRGVADMKGSIASMMLMAKQFTETNYKGSLGFLITSGEEGDDYDKGTPYVMEELKKLGIHPDYCIVGEPSSTSSVGDVIKIGRRGSLSGKLELRGKQGHVAYPHLADNPIHRMSKPLDELVSTKWDDGNEHFPPTSFQIIHIHSGGSASNIIPGELIAHFNFRFSTEQTAEILKEAVENTFTKHDLAPFIQWRLSGNPFLTARGQLLESTVKAIEEITHNLPELSTSGGTSDGRFIAPYGVEVIELGPSNETIHQVNEKVALADLEKLAEIYLNIAKDLLV